MTGVYGYEGSDVSCCVRDSVVEALTSVCEMKIVSPQTLFSYVRCIWTEAYETSLNEQRRLLMISFRHDCSRNGGAPST